MEFAYGYVNFLSFFFIGVAYSKHIVYLYSYHVGDDVKNYLEVCLTMNPIDIQLLEIQNLLLRVMKLDKIGYCIE